MYKLLLRFLSNWNQCVTSDDIFAYFLRMGYNVHQIAGVIGYARRVGKLQIIGRRKSKRIRDNINVYA